jgi:hypothetical protein
MNPFVIRYQATVTLIALSAAGILGYRVLVAVLCGVIVTTLIVLRLQYNTRLNAHSGQGRGKDLAVTMAGGACAAVPALVTALAEQAGFVSDSSPTIIRVLAVALAATTTAIVLSSLVDWFVVLPWLEGRTHAAPWQPEGDALTARRRLTRLWLAHRLSAVLVMSLAMVAVPVYMGTAAHDGSARAVWLSVAAVLTGAFAPLNRHAGILLNPPALVGDAVLLDRGPGYVRDVSLRGVTISRREDASTGFTADPLAFLTWDDLRDLHTFRREATPLRIFSPREAAPKLSPPATGRPTPPLGRVIVPDGAAVTEAEDRSGTGLVPTIAVLGTVFGLVASTAQIASLASSAVIIGLTAGTTGLVAAMLVARAVAGRKVRRNAVTSPDLVHIRDLVTAQQRALRNALSVSNGDGG